MSKEKLRDTFMDIDDVLEHLTADTLAYKALNPVMMHLQELERLVKDAWPVAVEART